MSLRSKIELKLGGLLDELDLLEDMSEVLTLKAKIECIRLAAETLSKLKSGGEASTTYVLPDFYEPGESKP